MIREAVLRRPDGSIDTASIDDGEGCYVFLHEGTGDTTLTLQFEQGGKPMGRIRLTDNAVAKLTPLFNEITTRNEGKEAT